MWEKMSKSIEINYEDCLRQREAAMVYVEFINKLLQMNTRDSFLQFVQLYMQEDFVQNYMASRSELISGRVLAMITCDELALERPVLYAERFKDLDHFILAWDELKFCLWELEFIGDEETKKHFWSIVSENQISDVVLKYLLHTSAVEKKIDLVRITEMALSENDVRLASLLLQQGCDLCPEDEEIPRLLKELQAAIGG